MSEISKVSKKRFITIFIIIFAILSYTKLFTAQVTFYGDSTLAIVKTNNIQLLNNKYYISDRDLPNNWYDDYGFEIVFADEMALGASPNQSIHSFAVTLWWIMLPFASIMILLYFPIRVFKRIKNRNKNVVG